MKRQLLILTLYCCFNTFGQDIGYDNLFKLIEEKKFEDVTEFLHSPEGKGKVQWALKHMEFFGFSSDVLVKTAMGAIFPHGESTKKEDVVIDNKLISMIISYDDGKNIITDCERLQLAHTIIEHEKVRSTDVLFLSLLIVKDNKGWWKDVFFRSFNQFTEREKNRPKKDEFGLLKYPEQEWCRKSLYLRQLFLHFMSVDTKEVFNLCNVESSLKKIKENLSNLMIELPREKYAQITIPVPKSFNVFIDNYYKAIDGEFDQSYWSSYSDRKHFGGEQETQKKFFSKYAEQLKKAKYKYGYIYKIKLKRILDKKCDVRAFKYKKYPRFITVQVDYGYMNKKLSFVSDDGGAHWMIDNSGVY